MIYACVENETNKKYIVTFNRRYKQPSSDDLPT